MSANSQASGHNCLDLTIAPTTSVAMCIWVKVNAFDKVAYDTLFEVGTGTGGSYKNIAIQQDPDGAGSADLYRFFWNNAVGGYASTADVITASGTWKFLAVFQTGTAVDFYWGDESGALTKSSATADFAASVYTYCRIASDHASTPEDSNASFRGARVWVDEPFDLTLFTAERNSATFAAAHATGLVSALPLVNGTSPGTASTGTNWTLTGTFTADASDPVPSGGGGGAVTNVGFRPALLPSQFAPPPGFVAMPNFGAGTRLSAPAVQLFQGRQSSAARTFSFSYSVAITASPSVVKQPKLVRSASVTATSALARLVGLIRAVASTATLSTLKNPKLIRAVSATATLSSTKQLGSTRAVSVAATVATAKQTNAIRAAAVSVSPSTVKQAQLVRTQGVTATPSATSLKVALRSYTVAIAATLAAVKQAQLVRAVSVVATLSTARLLSAVRAYAVSATATVTTAKQTQLVRSLSVTVSPSSSALKVALRSFSVSVAVSAAVLWQVGLIRAVAVAATLSAVKAVQVKRSLSVTASASAAALKVALRAYSVSIAATVTSSRQVLLARSVSVAVALNPVTQIQRIFGVASAVTVARVAQVQRAFARSVAVTASISQLVPHAATFALNVLVTPSVMKRPQLSIGLGVTAQPSAIKAIARAFSLPVTVTAGVARRFFRSFSVLVSALVAIVSEVVPDSGPATGTWATLDIQTERVILRVGSMQKDLVGNRKRLFASFYTFGDSRLKDPDSVTFTVNGVDFPGVREGVGVYHYDFVPTLPGVYKVSVSGAGAVAAVAEASFEARALS